MKNKTIIFRTTNSCNLNCLYCYDKFNHSNIKKENEKFNLKIPYIIQNIEKLWKNKNANSEIIFHGGEPLIINEKNYAELLKNIKALYPNSRFTIQTNGTLLSEKYIKTFKEYNVHIGISLDGYNETTNKYRIYKNGKNSFFDVLEKIKLLNNNHITFGIIMTLNSSIITNEEKLYNFIRDYNLKCNVRPAFKSDIKDIDYMSNEEYYTFFKNLFNIWINDTEKTVKLTQIKEIFDEFLKVLEPSYNVKSCSLSGKCFQDFICLDIEGNLYLCNRTYNNKDFFYGNLNKISDKQLEEKIETLSKKRNDYIKNSKCKKCELYNQCHGGCPASAYYLHGNVESMDDEFCKSKIKIKHYINEYLEKNKIKEDYWEIVKNG